MIDIELDKVLDLTDTNTLKQLSKNLDNPLIKEDIAPKLSKCSYQIYRYFRYRL